MSRLRPQRPLRSRSARLGLAILALLVWVNVCVASQIGVLAAVGLDALVGFTIALAIAIRTSPVATFRREMGGGVLVGVVLWGAYVFATGWRWSDALLVALAFGACFVARRRLKQAVGLVFVALAWSFLSANTWLDVRPLAVDPNRFQQLRAGAPHGDVPFTLALSGGGFRAAVMHAGLLSALEDLRYVPTNITAVSGGAIIGAFYAIGGAPPALRDAVIDGRFNLFRELAAVQNAARLPLPVEVPGTNVRLFPWVAFSRTDVQANLLARLLYGHRRFRDLETDPAVPHLLLGTTNLRNGASIGIAKDGVIEIEALSRPLQVLRPPMLRDTPSLIDWHVARSYPASDFEHRFPQEERISDFVAASGAFPGAFQSLTYRPRTVASPGPGRLFPLRLADGGITDNSGITLALSASTLAHVPPKDRMLRGAVPLHWGTHLVIASDAGAVFEETSIDAPSVDALRAIDIVHGRNVVLFPDAPSAQLPGVLVISPRLLETRLSPRASLARDLLSDLQKRTFGLDRHQLEILLKEAPGSLPANGAQYRETYVDGDEGFVDERYLMPLAEDLADCLATFVRTGTLDAVLTQADAGKLYRLGRYLVFLEQSRIAAAFDCLSAARQSPEDIALCKAALIGDAYTTYVQSNLRGLPDPDR